MHSIVDPTDIELRTAVEAAVESVLGDLATHVAVATESGTVTITGRVTDYDAHVATLKAIEAVDGVHGVADEIEVGGQPAPGTTDTVIAKAAQQALQHCDGIPLDSVEAEVREGILTLVGTVSSPEERMSAERAVIYLPGLVQIWNRIHVVPHQATHEATIADS